MPVRNHRSSSNGGGGKGRGKEYFKSVKLLWAGKRLGKVEGEVVKRVEGKEEFDPYCKSWICQLSE